MITLILPDSRRYEVVKRNNRLYIIANKIVWPLNVYRMFMK